MKSLKLSSDDFLAWVKNIFFIFFIISMKGTNMKSPFDWQISGVTQHFVNIWMLYKDDMDDN